jgi:hypothetical protein
MARRSDIAPYRQGQLDGLCGLYAIIGSRRTIVAASSGTAFGGSCCWRLLARPRTRLERRVVHVIGAKPLYELAKAAERHLASEHGVAVTVSRSRGRSTHLTA